MRLSVAMLPLLVTFALALVTAWLLLSPHVRGVPNAVSPGGSAGAGSSDEGGTPSDELVRRELEELQHDLDTGKSTPEDF